MPPLGSLRNNVTLHVNETVRREKPAICPAVRHWNCPLAGTIHDPLGFIDRCFARDRNKVLVHDLGNLALETAMTHGVD
jgi:hypothetical protein